MRVLLPFLILSFSLTIIYYLLRLILPRNLRILKRIHLFANYSTEVYVIQQRHEIFRWFWVDASTYSGKQDTFTTLEEAQKMLPYFEEKKVIEQVINNKNSEPEKIDDIEYINKLYEEKKPIDIKNSTIKDKVKILLSLSDEFLFIEYYSHTGKNMWKIKNVYTQYAVDIIVLCDVEEGIEKALDIAIEYITKAKLDFYNKKK